MREGGPAEAARAGRDLEGGSATPRRWILLRGLGRERRHWFGFADRLASRLGVPCEVVDLPGVGRGRFETGSMTPEATAEVVGNRIEGWLEDAGGPVGVLGLSVGAMVGLELCHESALRGQPETGDTIFFATRTDLRPNLRCSGERCPKVDSDRPDAPVDPDERFGV